VAEDREVQEQEFRRFAESKQIYLRSREERFQSRPLDLEGDMAEIHAFWRRNPSEKVEERIPEELGKPKQS
jgi:hypothetical protein